MRNKTGKGSYLRTPIPVISWLYLDLYSEDLATDLVGSDLSAVMRCDVLPELYTVSTW